MHVVAACCSAERLPWLTLPGAYATQWRVAGLRIRRGESIAGYKIGCVIKIVQRQLGMDHRVFEYVFDSELCARRSILDPDRFDSLAVKGERVAQDICSPEQLLSGPTEVIEAVLPVIELHNNVLRVQPRTAQDLIRNNALHAGVVLPCGDGAQATNDKISVPERQRRSGRRLWKPSPEGIAGHCSTTEHVIATEGCLRTGTLILTGSPLPLYPVKPGDHMLVRSERCRQTEASIKHTLNPAARRAENTPRADTIQSSESFHAA